MIEFTRKEYLELYLNGQPVVASGRSSNRHTTIVEAAEHATEHAVEIGAVGTYEVRVGGAVFYTIGVTEIVLDTPVEPPIDPPPEPDEVTIDPIPNINLAIGQTHDMLQYVNGAITDSILIEAGEFVMPLETIANYNPATGKLTGLTEGEAFGLKLEVTY